MIKFDPTINLGTILTLLGALVAVFAAWASITNRLTAIETKIQPIWAWWNDDLTSEGERVKTVFDEKVEHAVRGAVAGAVLEVLKQDRQHRPR